MAERPGRGESIAPAMSDSLPRYDFDIDPDSDTTHARVVRLVGSGKRVLELGPATGYMSRVFRDRGCQVVAIELDPPMAARAEQFCERMIVGDVETLDLPALLGEDRFDVIVAADVLEHLKNPDAVLRALKPFLLPTGYVVASVPNVAHGSVRLALLAGQFRYSQCGLLDSTHLRFFTRESIQELFEEAGFAITQIFRQPLLIDRAEVTYDPTRVPEGLVDVLSRDPDALAYQFVVVGYPAAQVALDRNREQFRELADGLRQQVETLSRERDELSERLVDLHDQLVRRDDEIQLLRASEVADGLRQRVETLSRQREDLRERLLELHDQVVRRDDEIQVLRAREAQLRASETHIENLKRELAERADQIEALELARLNDLTALSEELRLKEVHIAQLQTALDRILYSVPGRLLRGIRRAATFGRY